MTARVWLLALAACGAGSHGGHGRSAAVRGHEITLYRDNAVIQQRFELDAAAAGEVTVTGTLAAGVTMAEVAIVDRGGLTIAAVRAEEGGSDDVPRDAAVPAVDANLDDELDLGDGPTPVPYDPVAANVPTTKPVPITIAANAPHAGHYAVTVAYVTNRVTWSAAYTMETTPARDAATARGALAILNGGGIVLAHAHVTVIDEQLGVDQKHRAEVLSALATGHVALDDAESHPAQPHDLGTLDVGDGEVRTELFAPSARRALRSVLVFDPIGTELDNPNNTAVRDEPFGVTPPPKAPTRVSESIEIVRDAEHDRGLPGGAARLVERQADGNLAVLAEGRMFDAATRVAAFDALSLGVAHDVIGHRARRDFNLDDDRRRLTEDFTIELENQRARPVQVVMVEHLYRGANWALAFHSVHADQDGTQEISMRTEVPAKGKASVLYVVVYWWDAPS